MPLQNFSSEERQVALEKALEMRRKRADFRRKVKQGDVTAQEILAGKVDDVVGRMRVAAFLESLPGVGRVRSRRIMGKIGISSSRRVQGLGERQRRLILEELEMPGKTSENTSNQEPVTRNQ
jgi:hypothetical protein